MAEAPQSPLFAHDEPDARYTIKDLNRFLTRTGIEYTTATGRVTAYARNRQIHVRERGKGATSPNKYALADVAAALLLSAVQDAGVADNAVLNAVSESLYSWHPGIDRERSPIRTVCAHPLVPAVMETVYDQAFWQLQIDTFRNMETGERRIIAAFYPAGEVDPNEAPAEPEAVRQLRERHPAVQVESDPRADERMMPIATIQIPAFFRLPLLRPIVAPSGN